MKPLRSDAQLMRELRDDASALEELYLRHVDRVTAFAARRCDQPADVADLVAITFLTVLESSTTYDQDRGEVGPWIIGIASQIYANRIRKRYRERRALSRIRSVELSPDDIVALEERIDASRLAPSVERALQSLRHDQREALRMVVYDGLSIEEAAQALRVTHATLRKRLSRARAALRKHLDSDKSSIVIGRMTEEVGR